MYIKMNVSEIHSLLIYANWYTSNYKKLYESSFRKSPVKLRKNL